MPLQVRPCVGTEEILWKNLQLADEHFDFSFFCCAALAWCNLHPDKSLCELEQGLRRRAMNTHIFIDKPALPLAHAQGSNTSDTALWAAHYSVRPYRLARKEVLQKAGSYEGNFKQLRFAGHYAQTLWAVQLMADRSDRVALICTNRGELYTAI